MAARDGRPGGRCRWTKVCVVVAVVVCVRGSALPFPSPISVYIVTQSPFPSDQVLFTPGIHPTLEAVFAMGHTAWGLCLVRVVSFRPLVFWGGVARHKVVQSEGKASFVSGLDLKYCTARVSGQVICLA